MNKTKIEWATHTWNPVTGCLHGCSYCYAKRIANRFATGNGGGQPFVYDSPDAGPFPANFDPTFHRYRLDEPAKLKKPARIFVVSMGDLFGSWVPDEWIIQVFEACKKAPQHKYLFLTKNPKRYVELAEKNLLPCLDNFWYGQTCTIGTVKAFFGPYHQFLSAEPLQGVVEAYGFEWVILGAETGNRKGKHVPTIEEIVDTLWASNGLFFMKDSLMSIRGESHMVGEIPRELQIGDEELEKWRKSEKTH